MVRAQLLQIVDHICKSYGFIRASFSNRAIAIGLLTSELSYARRSRRLGKRLLAAAESALDARSPPGHGGRHDDPRGRQDFLADASLLPFLPRARRGLAGWTHGSATPATESPSVLSPRCSSAGRFTWNKAWSPEPAGFSDCASCDDGISRSRDLRVDGFSTHLRIPVMLIAMARAFSAARFPKHSRGYLQ